MAGKEIGAAFIVFLTGLMLLAVWIVGAPVWSGEVDRTGEIRGEWHLGFANYSGHSLDISSEEASPGGIELSPDGRTLIIVGGQTDTVHEYRLSDPFNLSTANYTGNNFSVGNTNAGLEFGKNGEKMYIVSGAIREYNLSDPYNISTAQFTGDALNVGSEENFPQAIGTAADGTHMYIVGFGGVVYQYDLSTAWEIETGSYSGHNFSIVDTAQIGWGMDVRVSQDRMWISNSIGEIFQYELQSPDDVSTSIYEGIHINVENATGEDLIYGLTFASTGEHLYFVGANTDTVYQYDLAAPNQVVTSPLLNAILDNTGWLIAMLAVILICLSIVIPVTAAA